MAATRSAARSIGYATTGRAGSPTRPPATHSCAGLLDENAAFRRPDVVVEVAQEVHSEQAIDIIMTEVEYVDRKIHLRETEHGELGHAEDITRFSPIAVWTFVRRNPSRGP